MDFYFFSFAWILILSIKTKHKSKNKNNLLSKEKNDFQDFFWPWFSKAYLEA